MTSFAARAVLPMLRRQFERRPRQVGQLDEARRALDALGGRLKPPPRTMLIDESIGGVPCERILPATAPDDVGILYLHGGGFIMGSRRSHRGLVAHLAHAVGATAILAEYRLAPEHPFPAGLDDALTVYQHMLDEFSPGQILISGDSAGGGLALALALRIRDGGLPLPAGVAMISPWTDLAGTGESLVTNAGTEIMLDPTRITEVGGLYHPNHSAEEPYVSPLYGAFGDLPPLLVQVGGDEILLSDGERVIEKAISADIDATLRVWPGMWHVWHMLTPFVPEARGAINEYARWAMRVLG